MNDLFIYIRRLGGVCLESYHYYQLLLIKQWGIMGRRYVWK